MHKLILFALLGCALLALTGAEEEENSVRAMEEEEHMVRDIRASGNGGKKKKCGKKCKARKADPRSGKKNGEKKKCGKKCKTRKSARSGKKTGEKNKKNEEKEKCGKKCKARKATKSLKPKNKPAVIQKSLRQTCPVSDSCVATAVNYLKISANQAANFIKQKSRIEKQNTTGIRKGGKKDVFGAALNRLTDFAGGNKSAPACGKLTSGAGVDQIKNLTGTLEGCSASIKQACDITALPQPNVTATAECDKRVTAFVKAVDDCKRKTGAEACTCWAVKALATEAAFVKTCSLADEAKAMAKALKSCKDSFSVCRKFEDDVAGAIHSCSVSTDGLKSKLKSLTANTAAVTDAKTKIEALVAGTKLIVRRQVAATCTELISISTELLSTLNDSPASPLIPQLAKRISGSLATCTENEKASLKSVATRLEDSITAIAVDISAAQATLLQVTGSTASPAAIEAAPSCSTDSCAPPQIADATEAPAAATTPAVTATKAPSAKRRRQAVEDFLKSKLL